MTPHQAALEMQEAAAKVAEETPAHGLAHPLVRESIAAAIRALPLHAEPARPALDNTLRCKVTSNLCGTDTWATGHPCQCASCQQWLSHPAPDADVTALLDAYGAAAESVGYWTYAASARALEVQQACKKARAALVAAIAERQRGRP
jgi:hypothetical protein